MINFVESFISSEIGAFKKGNAMYDEEEDVDALHVETATPISSSVRARRPQVWEGEPAPLGPAYALGILHAEAMLIMEKTNWPLGDIRKICIGTKPIDRKERKRRGTKDKIEKVYVEVHVIRHFPGVFFTRSGAVYRGESPDPAESPCVLVDFTTDEWTNRYWYQEAFRSIIDEGNKILADFR